MKVFFYALFFHLTLNIYVFWRGWQILKHRKIARGVLAAVFIVEFLIYLTGLLLQQYLSDDVVQIIGFIGTSWMLFLIYMSMALLVVDTVFWVHKRRRFLPESVNRHPNYTRGTLFLILSLAVVAILWRGNVKFNNPAVVNYEINIAKTANGIDSLRIAMIGDTHFGYLINRKFAERYVDLIMAQKPDLILFAGDIIDAGLTAPVIKLGDELRRLHAPLGVFTCTGNHEYRYDAEANISWLNHVGINVLRDSAVLVDNAFYIIGREDVEAPFQRKTLQEIVASKQIDTSKPLIVLNHNPHNFDEEIAANVDLLLSGHTHRGQFFPGNIVTDLKFPISHGYRKFGNTNVVVTSGLGLSGPQYRIGSRSEIVMLNVRFGRSDK
jgi:predicted MPP superfamily phosphohydrolase